MRILFYLNLKKRSVGLNTLESDVYRSLIAYEVEKMHARHSRNYKPSCPTNLKYLSLT